MRRNWVGSDCASYSLQVPPSTKKSTGNYSRVTAAAVVDQRTMPPSRMVQASRTRPPNAPGKTYRTQGSSSLKLLGEVLSVYLASLFYLSGVVAPRGEQV